MDESSQDTYLLNDEELKSFTLAILKRHGIDFTCYEPKSLKRRIAHAMYHFKFNSIHELWVKILREHNFIYPFMDEISVGLTSMFRDPILWKWLRDYIKDEFRKDDMKIWHAGCSTGEEVYTMGIVLKETHISAKASAIATDISMQSIKSAQEGAYHKMKMDEYVSNYIAFNPSGNFMRYCELNGDQFVMQKKIIEHVNFSYHNLITDAMDEQFDIIFCRNVMIYFDNLAKKRLFEKFYNALKPGGLFIIGFYDAVLPHLDQLYFDVKDMDAKIFVKKST